MSQPTTSRSPRSLAEDSAPVRVEIDVAWGDMDAFQHVNNVVYLRWFESARIEFFRKTGFIEHMEHTGVGPILAETRCRFRFPVTFPDRITATVSARDVGEDRFVMDYRLYSRRHERLVAEGDGRIVCYDFNAGSAIALPGAVRAAMAALEAAAD
jgi:acyl-CoA thioester hydrolase